MGALPVAILTGLSAIAVLLIASLGLAVIFGMMRIINLAHGEFIMAGAYVTLVGVRFGLPLPVDVLLAGVAVGAFGLIVERVIIRPLYGRLLDSMLATWGLSLVMTQVAVIVFGPETAGIPTPLGALQITGYSFSIYSALLIPVALALIAGIYFVFTRTSYGLQAQAATQVPTMARAVGVDANRINMVTFGFGSALAGLAGGVLAPVFAITPTMGAIFVAQTFLAVVVAGPVILSGTSAAAGLLGGLSTVVSLNFAAVAGQGTFLVAAIVILRFYRQGISAGWRRRL